MKARKRPAATTGPKGSTDRKTMMQKYRAGTFCSIVEGFQKGSNWFFMRPLRLPTSTPVLVPMIGGSCTLPGASNLMFLRLSLMRCVLPLWLSGTFLPPHRTSWPARVGGVIS